MKTLKVKFIKHPGKFRLGYHQGEKAELEEKQVEELMKAGVVCIVEKSDPDNSDLPADLPGRKELAASGMKLADLSTLTADDLTQIKGIGKGTAEKIVKYLNS